MNVWLPVSLGHRSKLDAVPHGHNDTACSNAQPVGKREVG